jgi:hypothetical protein
MSLREQEAKKEINSGNTSGLYYKPALNNPKI